MYLKKKKQLMGKFAHIDSLRLGALQEFHFHQTDLPQGLDDPS